jgi:hypothetical protein
MPGRHTPGQIRYLVRGSAMMYTDLYRAETKGHSNEGGPFLLMTSASLRARPRLTLEINSLPLSTRFTSGSPFVCLRNLNLLTSHALASLDREALPTRIMALSRTERVRQSVTKRKGVLPAALCPAQHQSTVSLMARNR